MVPINTLMNEIYQVLRVYCEDMILYDENGKRVFEPADARRFYVLRDNILVTFREDNDNSMLKIHISDSINFGQLKGFIETLRALAERNNILFSVTRMTGAIKLQDFSSKSSLKEQYMNIFEGMYGTSKTSYLKLDNARMIVRHSAKVKENMIGARGRDIDRIFVENANGERFLFPTNQLTAARAMTNHISNGGSFTDSIGERIVEMARDFRNLAIAKLAILPEPLHESVISEMRNIKRSFMRLADSRTYTKESQSTESLMEHSNTEYLTILDNMLGNFLDESVITTIAKRISEDWVSDLGPKEEEDDEDEDSFGFISKTNKAFQESAAVNKLDEWFDAFDGKPSNPKKIYKSLSDWEQDVNNKFPHHDLEFRNDGVNEVSVYTGDGKRCLSIFNMRTNEAEFLDDLMVMGDQGTQFTDMEVWHEAARTRYPNCMIKQDGAYHHDLILIAVNNGQRVGMFDMNNDKGQLYESIKPQQPTQAAWDPRKADRENGEFGFKKPEKTPNKPKTKIAPKAKQALGLKEWVIQDTTVDSMEKELGYYIKYPDGNTMGPYQDVDTAFANCMTNNADIIYWDGEHEIKTAEPMDNLPLDQNADFHNSVELKGPDLSKDTNAYSGLNSSNVMERIAELAGIRK